MPSNVADARNADKSRQTGVAPIGDVYLQTRISILAERKWAPAIILNSTLKTASTTGKEFEARRYFDTPGYYFDLEMGKSIHINAKIINELRIVADMGFLCWETTGSLQNDAVMGGIKVMLTNQWVRFESSFSGYKGWMDDGDNPLVFTSRLTFVPVSSAIDYFAEYQRGIHDYPYHHFQVGLLISIITLTPKYDKKVSLP
jgi:hypothetical protein